MKKIDMTHGPIGRKTIRFALLLALTGMLQQVFNTIDTIIMGQFVGKEAMAAVGSNTPIISLIVTFFIGISIGANVVISQMTGKGDREGVHRAVFSTLVFALAAGIVMTCLSEAVAGPLLSLLQVPEALMPLSLAYLRIFFLALPGILVYNFASAIFRSQGDTKTPPLLSGGGRGHQGHHQLHAGGVFSSGRGSCGDLYDMCDASFFRHAGDDPASQQACDPSGMQGIVL